MPRAPSNIASVSISDRIKTCANPEFAQWLYDWWQELNQRDPNIKLQYVYRRAMDSMIAHPDPLNSVKEAMKLPYIGPNLVSRLEKKLQTFLAAGGNLTNCFPQLSQPVLPDLLDTGENQEVKRKSTTTKKSTRAYVPTYRSGPYAMLLALLIESQSPESKGFCTRQDVLTLGQPYCQVPLEEGTFSALKGAIKKLEEKELVTRSGMPPCWALTEEGTQMAIRLWNSVERRSSAPIQHISTESASVNEAAIEELVENLDEDSNSLNEMLTFKWEPGTYEVSLLIDNREVKARNDRDYLVTQLASAGVPVEQRSLDLGDFLWIARRKQTCRLGTYDDLEEVVLDLVVERKTEDDLLHSICDGRFVEQKHRLGSCGLLNKIYLLEKYDGLDVSKIGESRFNAAIVHTQVLDDLLLRYTANLEDTLKFIIALHHDLARKHATKPIWLALQPDVNKIRRTQFLEELQRKSELFGRRCLMSYGCYSAINSKSGALTLADLFLRQLLTIRHMSAERAALIMEKFPTPISLYEHYSRLPNDQVRRDYFKDWAVEHHRKFGPVLSSRIFETFFSVTPGQVK